MAIMSIDISAYDKCLMVRVSFKLVTTLKVYLFTMMNNNIIHNKGVDYFYDY